MNDKVAWWKHTGAIQGNSTEWIMEMFCWLWKTYRVFSWPCWVPKIVNSISRSTCRQLDFSTGSVLWRYYTRMLASIILISQKNLVAGEKNRPSRSFVIMSIIILLVSYRCLQVSVEILKTTGCPMGDQLMLKGNPHLKGLDMIAWNISFCKDRRGSFLHALAVVASIGKSGTTVRWKLKTCFEKSSRRCAL